MLRRMSVHLRLYNRPFEKRSLSTFSPWENKVIESNGDYREESFLESHVGGPLYEHQASLPRLPVPSIHDTLDRFLPTALPLIKSESEKQALLEAVKKFPAQASQLQERLLRRKEECSDTSWLQLWWNTMGYLQVRDSVVINVSYFFHFADDPSSPGQVQRAASILTGVGQFRKQVCSGSLPAETIGKKDRKKTLCSTAYKYLFHACRIPKLVQDSYKIYDPSQYKHAVVVVKGHFFRLDIVDPATDEPLSLSSLETAIEECYRQAQGRGPAVELGWFTSSNRDDWARARSELLQVGGPEIKAALEALESGAVLICLDDDCVTSRNEVAEKLLHGGQSGFNRWFDKSIQFVVSKNGKAGLVGEHSMMDGMPVVQFADHVTKTTYSKCLNGTGNTSDCNVQPIFSDALLDRIGTPMTPLIRKAKDDFEHLAYNNALTVQSFQGYGSTFMKKSGYSPDAFVQVAMQLASYRLWGEQAGTYEATQVRPFLHGRTETTRSVSVESAKFCKRMGLVPEFDAHKEGPRKEKLKLLQDAVKAHVKYIGMAAQAAGVDRHFLGLSLLVNEGEKTPDLYNDPVFVRSKRWRVSTSHLTVPKFDNWGYGQVVPDGVGLSYSIHPKHCVFNVTALKEHEWTGKLAHLLEESLLELRDLVEMDQPLQSKL